MQLRESEAMVQKRKAMYVSWPFTISFFSMHDMSVMQSLRTCAFQYARIA